MKKLVVNIIVGLVVVMSIAVTPSPTYADEEKAEPVEYESYGWQIFASDVAGLALVVSSISVADDSEGLAQGLSVGTAALWGFGGPAIHLAHGNKKGALRSLGLRWGLSAGLATLFYAVTSDSEDDCSGTSPGICFGNRATAAVGGFLVGGVIAQVADWLVFSKKQVRGSRSSPRLTPTVQVSQQLWSVGAGGYW